MFRDRSDSGSDLAVSRRYLIRAAVIAAGVALGACAAPAAPTAAPPAPTTPKEVPTVKAPPPAAAPAPKEAPAKAQAPATPKPAEKVSLRLDWLVTGYHAPFYVAADKGWYRDGGLDVTIGEGKGSGSTIQLVATGGDTFGFADAGVMARTVVQGGPVVMVANLIPKGASAIIVREDSDVKTLKDLEGKSYGSAPTGVSYQLLPALLKANGADPDKLTMISVDNSTKMQAWLAGKYEATSVQMTDEAPKLKAQGVKFRAFVYGDLGLITMGHGIVVNTKTMQEKPDLVKSFVEASLRGWKSAFENPEEAAKILTRMTPDSKLEVPVVVEQIKASLLLSQTDNTKGKPLGWMADKDWQNTLDLLAQYADLKEKPPIDKLFTNRFVPSS